MNAAGTIVNTMAEGPVCPIPITDYPNILLAHGGGGRLGQMLIDKIFIPSFGAVSKDSLHDGAVFEAHGKYAYSTDSFVISPRFFPGGNIGSLAVHGTVNDLAMCGATPLYLSVGFILEEGLPMEELWQIVLSMAQAAREAGVKIVTGDTKVVERGKGDGVYINTSGIGIVAEGVNVDPRRAKAGDAIILSGFIADHGIAIMSQRESLGFESEIKSDSASVHKIVASVIDAIPSENIHVMRDPTRGGVATTLVEIAESADMGISLNDADIPVRPDVSGACEMLGLDPLYVANEGKALIIVDASVADAALTAVKKTPGGEDARIIGHVVDEHPAKVVLRTRIGGRRMVGRLSGEQLPRIC